MESNNVGAMWGPLMPCTDDVIRNGRQSRVFTCVCPFLARKHKPFRFFDIDGIVPIDLRFVGVTDNVLEHPSEKENFLRSLYLISCLWIEQPLAQISSLLVLRWLGRLILVGDIH